MTHSSANTQVWKELRAHANRVSNLDLSLLLADTNRFTASHLTVGNLLVDWTRQLVDRPILDQLDLLATENRVTEFFHSMSSGDIVNHTENRPALHMNQRCPRKADPSLQQMLILADRVRNGEIRGHSGKRFTDVVNIGIGGSHLGPEMVYRALVRKHGPKIHFVTNIHPTTRAKLLNLLDPDSTLFIIASKSYGTFETLDNARFIRQWMNSRVPPEADLTNHFIHVTSDPERVSTKGTVLSVPSSIGGRFSLWSAMGLAVAIAFGTDEYQELLAGALAMDRHVLETETESRNLAIKLALLALWNTNLLNTESHLILPYDPRLQLLPAYLQQLEMESNGKSLSRDGDPTSQSTSPIVWGGVETNGQHAYHQLLHQGTRMYSADIIVTRSTNLTDADAITEDWILANAVAQSTVMFAGYRAPSGHAFENIKGMHGSTLIVLQELNAYNLGALIALYEHKVACLGHLWNVNSFDQWGVEAGKQLANDVFGFLQQGKRQNVPVTTAELLAKIRKI